MARQGAEARFSLLPIRETLRRKELMHLRDATGPIICCALFTLIFVLLKTDVIAVSDRGPGPEYGLLFFVLPGMITAHLIRHSSLIYALVGALIAIPVCYTLRVMYFVRVRSLLQEMAYAGSAVFWCVMGALIYLLIRAVLLQITKE